MYKSLVAKSHIGVTSFKDQIIQFLTDVGLTMHDDQSGSEYVVFKMTGENDDQPPEYIQILWGSASGDPNYIDMYPYYYWDNSTHTGYGRSNNLVGSLKTASGSTYFVWLYGNKDKIFIRTLVQTDTRSVTFGFCDQRFDETLTTLTSPATAGSDVVLSVSDSSGFHVGQTYQIFSVVGEGRDKVTVTAISAGQITVGTLPASMSAGSLIGVVPSTFFMFRDVNNATGISCPNGAYNSSGTGSAYDNGYHYMMFINTPHMVSGRAGEKRVLYPIVTNGYSSSPSGYILTDFLSGDASDLGVEDLLTIGVPESGVVTSATSTTLVDSSKSWASGQHVDRYVILYSGTGYGQTRKITASDATSVTVSAWDVEPDATSYYRIVDEVYRVFNNVIESNNYYTYNFVREEI